MLNVAKDFFKYSNGRNMAQKTPGEIHTSYFILENIRKHTHFVCKSILLEV